MKHFEVVIIGGGINGCGLLRDLALNGVSTLLLEKGDFSSQTSQSSSKMLHGGIRYLENMDFALVQEALEEKNLWLKLTPHLCFERDFYLPLYNFSKYSPWMLKCGLLLYDFLSHFQNKPHQMYNKQETLEKIPSLKSEGLKGSGNYFDGVVDDAKLALECLYDALLEPQVEAFNYTEVVKVETFLDKKKIIYRSITSGNITEVICDLVVFTTGPFTDQLLPKLGYNWTPKMALSKGIHLWLKEDSLQTSGSVVLTTKEGRVVFVIPQRNSILVGTTETPVKEEMFNIQATDKEIQYLLNILKEYFPKSSISKDSILSTYAGVRPLVKENTDSENLGKVSRHHKIFRPDQRTYVLLGGKYTTFRKMCQELAQDLCIKLNKRFQPNLTLNPLRQHSLYPTFGVRPELSSELIQKIIQKEKVQTLDDLLMRRLSFVKHDPELLKGMNFKISL